MARPEPQTGWGKEDAPPWGEGRGLSPRRLGERERHPMDGPRVDRTGPRVKRVACREGPRGACLASACPDPAWAHVHPHTPHTCTLRRNTYHGHSVHRRIPYLLHSPCSRAGYSTGRHTHTHTLPHKHTRACTHTCKATRSHGCPPFL